MKTDEEEESGDDKKSEDDSENKMVRDILNNTKVSSLKYLYSLLSIKIGGQTKRDYR